MGCPTAGDINVLYGQVNWSKLQSTGWKPTAGYGHFGTASFAQPGSRVPLGVATVRED